MISCAWQHPSPSGLAMLHLELELKEPFRTEGTEPIVRVHS